MSKEIGNQNFEKFESWYAEREQLGDLKQYLNNGKLNKSEIAKELGFGRSVWSQNAQVKDLASAINAKLAKKLSIVANKQTNEANHAREKANQKVAKTQADNSKLLQKIAMLEEENRQLKLQLNKLEDFKTAREAFIEAGAALR